MEFKYGNAPLPKGQRIALECIANDIHTAGKPTVVCVCRHNVTDPSEDIKAADAIVSDFYFNKRWHKDGRSTLRQICERVIRWIDGVPF